MKTAAEAVANSLAPEKRKEKKDKVTTNSKTVKTTCHSPMAITNFIAHQYRTQSLVPQRLLDIVSSLSLKTYFAPPVKKAFL